MFLRAVLGSAVALVPTASYAAEKNEDVKLTLGFQEAKLVGDSDKAKPPVMTIDYDYVFSKWASGVGTFSMKRSPTNTGIVPLPWYKPQLLPYMIDKATIEKSKTDGFGGHMTLTWVRPKSNPLLHAVWDDLLCGTLKSVVVKATGKGGPNSPPIGAPPVTVTKIVIAEGDAYTALKASICTDASQANTSNKPVCVNQGSRSEGWSIGGKLYYSSCKNVPVCSNVGTKSEGWYIPNRPGLPIYANCSKAQ